MSTRAKRIAPEPAVVAEVLPSTTRRDGWTIERQTAFLRALASTHCVAAAARSVGMGRQSAYTLRARLKGQPFDMAWDAAFQTAFDRLAEAAMERAVNGVEVPHFHKGELIGTSRRYDERLTVALLAMRTSLLRAPAPPRHEASGYEAEDFRALLKRVALGPETWDGDERDDVAGWDGSGEDEIAP